MQVIVWIFAVIGFVVVGVLVLGLIASRKPEEYTGGADGDWERYRDKCTGTYNEIYDRPMTAKEIRQRDKEIEKARKS